jgi:hypothetical protein
MDRNTIERFGMDGLRRLIGRPVQSALVHFHTGRGRDSAGRRHQEVLALDDDHLEWTYDWTQWTFPLPERSDLCPQAPVLDDVDQAILRTSDEARERMGRAQMRMISFLQDGTRWLRESDYNHFRITRAIRSSRLVLGDQHANDFRRTVLEMMMRRQHRVGRRAVASWREA